MKLQKETSQKIVRDAAISIFLYALPVILMFLTFYITGQKPWEKSNPVQTEIRK